MYDWTFRRVVWATLVLAFVVLGFWLFYRFYRVFFILFIAIVMGTVLFLASFGGSVIANLRAWLPD